MKENATMMILKMIENGKITADEGVKLIDAVNSAGKASDMIHSVKKRVKKMAKDAEPKVKAAAETIVEKSAEFGSAVKKKINESKIKEKAEDVVDDIEDFFDDECSEVIEEYNDDAENKE